MQGFGVKPELCGGCAQCTPPLPTASHTSEKVLPHSQHISSVTTTPSTRVPLLLRWYISVLIQKVSSQMLNARCRIKLCSGKNMIKLQFDFECLFLPRPRRQFPPFHQKKKKKKKLKPWQNRDWKPFFLLCHFYLSGKRFHPFQIH